MNATTSLAVALGLGLTLSGSAMAQRAVYWDKAAFKTSVQHIIFIYEENRGFDNMFGAFPGANGIANAGKLATQTDVNGVAYPNLPPAYNTNLPPKTIDVLIPPNLPNGAFLYDAYLPQNQIQPDLKHAFYLEQMEINGGKMDHFGLYSDAGGRSMGFEDLSKTYTWSLAKQFTLMDNFFHSAFGGSYMNNYFFWTGGVPWKFPTAPASLVALVASDGKTLLPGAGGLTALGLSGEGSVTPDGLSVNTTQSQQLNPFGNLGGNLAAQLPPQTGPWLGDLLDGKGVNWKFYADGLAQCLAGTEAFYALPHQVQAHHMTPLYFANFAPKSARQASHTSDLAGFMSDLTNNTLPAVSIFKVSGTWNWHAGYANISDGDNMLKTLMTAIQASPAWSSTVVVISWDEHGGFWDHVAPPAVDRFGPGSRVPTIVASPFAQLNFVDHAQYETNSITRMIEDRFELGTMGGHDAVATPLQNTLQF